jgi:hypothetical protein
VSSSVDWAASFIRPLKCSDSVFQRPAFTAFKIHLSEGPSHSTCALDKPSLNRLREKKLAGIFVTQVRVDVLLGYGNLPCQPYHTP